MRTPSATCITTHRIPLSQAGDSGLSPVSPEYRGPTGKALCQRGGPSWPLEQLPWLQALRRGPGPRPVRLVWVPGFCYPGKRWRWVLALTLTNMCSVIPAPWYLAYQPVSAEGIEATTRASATVSGGNPASPPPVQAGPFSSIQNRSHQVPLSPAQRKGHRTWRGSSSRTKTAWEVLADLPNFR